MKSLLNKLSHTEEKKQETKQIASNLINIIKGNDKNYFEYEARISKINKDIENIETKYLDKESLQQINNTINYLKYNSEKGHLSQIINFKSREIYKSDIDLTIEKLQDLRKNNFNSDKYVQDSINKIKDSIENKIPKKNTYETRFSFMEYNLKKLSAIKTKKISQKDFDELEFCKQAIEKNKYLRKKHSQKQKKIIEKFEEILNKRNQKPEKNKKNRIMKYVAIGALALGSIISIESCLYNQRNKNILNEISKLKNEYREFKTRNKKQEINYHHLVAENEYKDSIYRQRYQKYEHLFEKYSKINLPKGYNEKEFRAILAGMGRIETSMGASKTAGKNDNESGEKWLMGYTIGEKYPEKYAGPDNQIKYASEKIKNALEGKEKYYQGVIYKNTKDEKIKYVLSVYNSGKELKENPRGQTYVSKIYPYLKGWKEYFNKQNTRNKIAQLNLKNKKNIKKN